MYYKLCNTRYKLCNMCSKVLNKKLFLETEKYNAARKNYVKGKNFFPLEMRNFACG